MSTPIGQEWLKRHYNLTNFTATHASFIGSSPNIELTSKGNVEETFVSKYAIEPISLNHVEFDMPDKEINLMLMFLHQNHGVFPKRRRDRFNKLTDDEIMRMQEAYRIYSRTR